MHMRKSITWSVTLLEFISASKRWHGLLSSLDNLRIISARLAPDLTRLVG